MKIFISHSRAFDFVNEVYQPLRQATFFKDQELILPHETDTFINTKPIIKTVDLLIAEVSFPSTGQGIELGWANDANIPIIFIYKQGSNVSQSLFAVSETFLEYTTPDDMIQKLLEHMQN